MTHYGCEEVISLDSQVDIAIKLSSKKEVMWWSPNLSKNKEWFIFVVLVDNYNFNK